MPISRIRNRLIRTTVLTAKWYIHHFPIQKGKGRLHDIAKALVKHNLEAVGEVEVKSVDGFRWRLDMKSVCQRNLFLQGRYSPMENRVLKSILSPGDVFVDIGAHVGYFSILASSLIGEKGEVFAFEPAPAMQKSFLRNLDLNKLANVHLFPYAVSNKFGEAVFWFNRTKTGTSSLRSVKSNETEEVKVKTVILDQYLEPDVKDRVKLVKIDIEGAELLALEGMREILTRDNSPDIMCEVTDEFLRDLGGSEETLLTLMKGYGYRAFWIEASGLKPIHGSPGVFQYNVLFTKRQHISLKE